MKSLDGLDSLLDDVLHDEQWSALRAATHTAGLRELTARKRIGQNAWPSAHHLRRARWVTPLAAAAVLLILARLFFWTAQSEPHAPQWLVHTRPLPAAQLVTTADAPPVAIVRTSRPLGVVVATHPSDPTLVVVTQHSATQLNDEELLASFDGAPCGVMTDCRGRKKLTFFDAEAKKRFMGELP